jgi:hypothetical protein
MASRDARPRAFGEDARWRYYRGAALNAVGQLRDAEGELRLVVSNPARQWVQGRAHLEIARLSLKLARRDIALPELHAASRDCRADHDGDCVTDARKLLKSIGAHE